MIKQISRSFFDDKFLFRIEFNFNFKNKTLYILKIHFLSQQF